MSTVALPAAVTIVAALVFGYVLARDAMPPTVVRYLPWIAGRSLGLAAYGTLFGLVLVGLWTRHPWRLRRKVLHPETLLRTHVALAAATVVLLIGHVVSLVLDKYAGVGLRGMLVPGGATYRPTAVALGVIAMYLLVLVAGTASLAGRLIGRSWLAIHRIAALVFALAWVHGVLAGTDTPRLKIAYAVSGVFVLALAASRYMAGAADGAAEPRQNEARATIVELGRVPFADDRPPYRDRLGRSASSRR